MAILMLKENAYENRNSLYQLKANVRQKLPPEHTYGSTGKKVGYKIKIHTLQAKQFEDIYKGFILNHPHIFFIP